MERNITIGLVIALVLTCVGAFWMSGNSDGSGGLLLDFLQNNTDNTNTTTADNSSINETINNTLTDNSTLNNSTNSTTVNINFSASAEYSPENNIVLVSVYADENITVDELNISYIYSLCQYMPDDIPEPEHISMTNVSLPTVVEVPVQDYATAVSYSLNILFANGTYQIPQDGEYVVNITTDENI